MGQLPNFKPRQIAKILKNAGFIEDTTKSSHRTYHNPNTRKFTTVSFHPGTIPQGTLRAIIKQSGMTIEKFLSYRKKEKKKS